MDLDSNPYSKLGLEGGSDTTEAEIKKAYKKKALQLHPDKRKGVDRKVAEDEFDQLQKAYELLMDPEGRKAYDQFVEMRKARRAKLDKHDAKRRKMREDLEAREAQAAVVDKEKEITQKLKNELDRIRRESEAARRQSAAAAPSNSYATPFGGAEPTASPQPTGDGPSSADAAKARMLKVTWSRAATMYTAQELKDIFKELGEVEDVVLRDPKKKKGIALVVMGSVDAALNATQLPLGNYSNPLEVHRMSTEVPGDTKPAPEGRPSEPRGSDLAGGAAKVDMGTGAGTGAGSGGGAASGSGPMFPSGGGGGSQLPGHKVGGGGTPMFGSGGNAPMFPSGSAAPMFGSAHSDFESVTLMRMRQAAERARLIKEMQEEDAAEEEDTAKK